MNAPIPAPSASNTIGRRARALADPCLIEPMEPRILMNAGDLDPTFGVVGAAIGGGPGVVFTDLLGATRDGGEDVVLVQTDGKLLVAGFSEWAGSEFALARYNTDGSLDSGFGASGVAKSNFGSWAYATSLATGSDGRIVVAGFLWNPTFTGADFAAARFNTDGTLDTSFGGDGTVVVSFGPGIASANGVAVDSSGRTILVGSQADADSDFLVVRLNADGSLDGGFGAAGVVETDFTPIAAPSPTSDIAHAVLIGGDGSILVGGGSTDNGTFPFTQSFALARYESDGTLDATFGVGGRATAHVDVFGGVSGVSIYGMAFDSTGGIIAAGAIENGGLSPGSGSAGFGLARFDADGTLDASFGTGGIVTTPQGEPGFENSAAMDVAVDASDRIIVGGSVFTLGDFGFLPQFGVSRYDSSGALDTSFGVNGRSIIEFASDRWSPAGASGVAIDSTGGIVAVGMTTDAATGAGNEIAVARLDSNGSLDTAFDNDGLVLTGFTGSTYQSGSTSHLLAVQSDGRIILGGTTDSDEGIAFALVRHNDDGSLDTSFGTGGRTTIAFAQGSSISAIAIQSDGGILAAGSTPDEFGYLRGVVARVDADGSLDTSFGVDGLIVTPFIDFDTQEWINAIAVDSSGRILTAGFTQDSTSAYSAVARYNSDGTLDTTFDGDGRLEGGGYGAGDVIPFAIEVTGGNQIVLAGYSLATSFDFGVRRLNQDGTADTSFGGDGTVTTDLMLDSGDIAADLAIDSGGGIVVVGSAFDTLSFETKAAIVRYNADGTLDTGFDGDGILLADLSPSSDAATAVSIDSAGRVVVVGYSSTFYDPASDVFLARYNADGTLDSGFGTGGLVISDFSGGADYPLGLALASDGRILVGGWTDDANALNSDFVVARFLPEDVHVEFVDIDRDLHHVVIQLDNSFLDPEQAANAANYRLIAAHGDANNDGNAFNDGDEQVLTVSAASIDTGTGTVTLATNAVLFDDVFRIQVDGDDAGADGTPGLGLRDGDYTADIDMLSLTFAEDLLDRVIDLGLEVGGGLSLIVRMEIVVFMLDSECGSERGVIALLRSFVVGVNNWFRRGNITVEQRDSLIADAEFIIFGLTST